MRLDLVRSCGAYLPFRAPFCSHPKPRALHPPRPKSPTTKSKAAAKQGAWLMEDGIGPREQSYLAWHRLEFFFSPVSEVVPTQPSEGAPGACWWATGSALALISEINAKPSKAL